MAPSSKAQAETTGTASRYAAANDVLRRDGFALWNIRWGQAEVTAAKRRIFRWDWLATALHVNVFLWKTDELDVAALVAAMERAKDWTVANHRGVWRGLQSGQAILVIAFPNRTSPDALAYAAGAWKWDFARAKIAAVSLADGRSVVPRGPHLMGALYWPFLRGLMLRLVE